MAATGRRYSKEEFARRGDALFESKVRPNLKAGDEEKYVAIDIVTGEFEIDEDDLDACDRLEKRCPKAQIWLVHAGDGYLDRFGWHALRGKK